jgi:hypothetical protein
VYNQSYQPSFGQQQSQVQSQYRGLQKTFQPTGNVQSFYQGQQPTSNNVSTQAQNYHTSNYVGNKQDHDAYLREDSMGPNSYATSRGQGMGTLNSVQGTYNVNVPTNQLTSGFQGSAQAGGFQGSVQAGGFQGSAQAGGFQGSAQAGGFQSTNNYHTQNYAGNRPDHDAYLREDSLRASTYATGRSQGINTLNSAQGQFNVNVPTNQFTSQGFNQSRSF